MTGISTAQALAVSATLSAPGDTTDKVSYLRSKNFWIGSRPTQAFVDNLYTLASKELLSAGRWNALGDASKPWDKQPKEIQALANNEAKPLKTADTDLAAKQEYLTVNGFWLGKKPGSGVIDNLYNLASEKKVSPEAWNEKGIARLAWDNQSEEFRSLTADVPPPPSPTEPSRASSDISSQKSAHAKTGPAASLPPISSLSSAVKASDKEAIVEANPETASPPSPQSPDINKAEDKARANAEAAKQRKIKDLTDQLAKIKGSTYSTAIKDPQLFGEQPVSMKSFYRILKPNKIREIEEQIRELQKGK